MQTTAIRRHGLHADLLPVDWDKTTAGKATEGKNQLRINKIMALGYLGKNYLWAGSPLMKNGAQLGGFYFLAGTYEEFRMFQSSL